ncbi:hypothetical protein SAY86_013994 [Trapa natans]|uniref:Nucleoside diphosphate kinase n=1 Tax=Trapa natans TaxID=22666 RepID=A0AAN7QME0_TRANT|nr:hypothetical protein SAY86_013994 [Trapa natans]
MGASMIPFLTRCFIFLLAIIPRSFCVWGIGREATLAIIKPDGLLGNYTETIKATIAHSGFKISREKVVQLDEEGAASFYAEHSTKKFFHGLIKYMTSGPVLVMVLEKENAISHWRSLIGPTDGRKAKITHPDSIRAICGTDVEKNCVHGSDSPQSSEREISFFFDIPSGSQRGGDDEHDEL